MTREQHPSSPLDSPSTEQPASIAAWLRARLPPGAQLTIDSRQVSPGDAFCAYPGERVDGREFIARAVLSGAAAVLWDRAGFSWPLGDEAAQRGIAGLRRLAGPIAAEFYGRPSEHLDLIAVTGTNGKTSCSHWIAHGFEATGTPAAVIGTLGSGLIGRLDPSLLTTPDAVSLQRILGEFARSGVKTAAVEASSIGLAQGRLDGARIVAAVFTNLSHDHLDYHRTMADYASAKSLLFAFPDLRVVVVNGDDPAAPRMLAALEAARATGSMKGATRRIACGFMPGQYDVEVDAMLLGEHWHETIDGAVLQVGGDFGQAEVELKLLGQFNAANALAVAATWLGLGMPFDVAMQCLRLLRPVRGRMETLDEPGLPLVIIDYAHTPDALLNVLKTLRGVAATRKGKLWCVFGAGGNRDAGKRPLMGQVVERMADRAVVTSDNPRSESPLRIVADIRAGFSREPWLTELDRHNAIAIAIHDAGANDLVLIAGKGHEEYQEIAGERLPFSDLDEARRALADRAQAEHA